jgi:hypothetical protein
MTNTRRRPGLQARQVEPRMPTAITVEDSNLRADRVRLAMPLNPGDDFNDLLRRNCNESGRNVG